MLVFRNGDGLSTPKPAVTGPCALDSSHAITAARGHILIEVTTGLAAAVRTLANALAEPEHDWRAIEQAWLEASLEAAETEHGALMREFGLALQLRDAEALGGLAHCMLARLEDSGPQP